MMTSCAETAKGFSASAAVAVFAMAMATGCISIPMGDARFGASTGDGPHVFERNVKVKSFSGLRCTLVGERREDGFELQRLRVWLDGEFDVKVKYADEYKIPEKMAFGLWPGWAVPRPSIVLPNEGDQLNPITPLLVVPLADVVTLGIPVIASVLFEPFSSPKLDNGSISQISIFGFCKYLDGPVSPVEELCESACTARSLRLSGVRVRLDGFQIQPDAARSSSIWLEELTMDEKKKGCVVPHGFIAKTATLLSYDRADTPPEICEIIEDFINVQVDLESDPAAASSTRPDGDEGLVENGK